MDFGPFQQGATVSHAHELVFSDEAVMLRLNFARAWCACRARTRQDDVRVLGQQGVNQAGLARTAGRHHHEDIARIRRHEQSCKNQTKRISNPLGFVQCGVTSWPNSSSTAVQVVVSAHRKTAVAPGFMLKAKSSTCCRASAGE